MPADLGRLEAELTVRLDRFNQHIALADKSLAQVARNAEAQNARIARSHESVERATQRVGRAVRTLIGVYALGIGVRFVRNQLEQVDALSKLGRQVGIATDELRRLEVGFELAGGTGEALRRGLLKFGQTFGQLQAGTGDLRTQFEKLDPAFLNTLRNTDSMHEALRLVADRMAGARSEQERLQIAFAAFGRTAGPAFAETLANGAASLDEMNEELRRLGVGVGLAETGPKVERLNDSFTRLSAVLNDNFLRGLFGTGEGLDRISDAVGDGRASEGVRNLATNFGRLVAFLAEIETQELAAWGDFFESLRSGEGFFSALDRLNEGLAPIEKLQKDLEATNREIEKTQKKLQAFGQPAVGPIALPQGVGALSASLQAERAVEIQKELAELEQKRLRLNLQIQSREPFVGPPVPLLPKIDLPDIGEPDLDSQATAAEKKLAAAQDRIFQQQEAFIQSMRESAAGALTEAEKLSLKLAETLGKIGEAAQQGTISVSEASEFQRAAIEEATAAITRAEQEALEKQQQEIGAFLEAFGGDAVSQAERVARAVQEALDKIPGLSPQQRAELEEIANRVEAANQETRIRDVGLDLLRAEAVVESESLFGLSRALENELARSEATLEASQLEKKIRDVYSGGDPAELEAALARNQRILEDRLADIDNSWDETFKSISAIGEDTLGDFFEGIAQGADASFEDMLRSFLLRIAAMEARALAADLVGALSGRGDEASSITGRLVGGAVGLLSGGGSSEEDANRAEATAARIGEQLLGSLETGAGALLEAGSGIGRAIGGAASDLLSAGLRAAAAILEAAVAAAAASTSSLGFFGLKEGGAVTSRGVVRLDRFERVAALARGGYVAPLIDKRLPVLAAGGYAAPRIERLERLTERLGPTIQLAEGGAVLERHERDSAILHTRSAVSDRRSSRDRVERTDRSEHFHATVERLAGFGPSSPAFVGPLSDRQIFRDRVEKTDRSERVNAVLERLSSVAGPSIPALVGEAGIERLLTFDRIREIASESRGDPGRAAWIAKRDAILLDHPEIRELSPGDVVIPDRKLVAFFERAMPRARAAEGGLVPLQAIPVERAMTDVLGGGIALEVEITLNNQGQPAAVQNQRVQRAGRKINIIGDLVATEIRRGGSIRRELQQAPGGNVQPRAT